MALEQFRAPALPTAPEKYDRRYTDQVNNILRQYFTQLDSLTPNQAFSYRADKYIFNRNTSAIVGEGELGWNPVDQTLNLGLANNVTNQIGQEYYARVGNTTGATIPNGSVVGFAGATANALLVSKFIANGTQPSLYMLGVMTHDLPDSGNTGYCTVWGFVRDLDTSGFSAGDVLYASPTVAGALTNVKPTAPNNVIPVAACVVSHPTAGVIFVRPTIEQDLYYGTFSDTTTQTLAAAYTPYTVTFNTTDIASGVSRGTPTSRIVTAHAGFYNFQFSSQVASTNSSTKKLWIWPRVNGVDVPNSNSEITVSGGGTVLVPAWNWTLSMNASDYFELVWAGEDTTLELLASSAQTGANGTPTFARPATPSMILTVTQVQQ